jgi:succinate-semialdehyde dehydrogenase/glutarate-semialdehyde dehydrogenase
MNLISVVSPLTGEKLHDIQAFSASEVADAFKSARKAQPAWAESAQLRSLVAKKLAALLAKEQSAVMDMLQAETGKSRSHAFEEVAGALGAIS